MATYSNLGVKLITTGNEPGIWGTSTNDNFSLFDATIVGYANITLTGPGTTGSPNSLLITDGTLTGPSDPRKRVIEFTGSPGAASYVRVDPNDFVGYWFIRNSLSGGHSIFLFQGNYDAARDYEIPNGTDVVVRCTGGGTVSYVYSVLENLKVNSVEANSIEVNSVITTGLDLGGQKITNLGTPTAGTDAATKAYVDAAGSIVFVSGNQILFRGASVPAGWAIVDINNHALRIVNASTTPTNGGSVDFTTAFTSARATTGVALTVAQLPAHSHTIRGGATSYVGTSTSSVAGPASVSFPTSPASITGTDNAGSGATHAHSVNLNVKYYDMRVIQKS